ncbi:MAG: class I adenylate-forming enzyme family protein [Desulfosudaceae bacterium]
MEPLSPNIIANALNCHAKNNTDGEAVVYGDKRITWRELAVRVCKLANALRQAGLDREDKVAFMFYNCPEFIEINYAIQVAGAIPVPMNYRFVAGEIEYQINHCDARIFIYDHHFQEQVAEAAPALTNLETFICRGETVSDNELNYETFLESGNDEDPGIETGWEDVAVMIYTGGTTGFPKGVMLTYGGHLDMFCHLFASIVTRAAEVDLSREQMRRLTRLIDLPGMGMFTSLARTKLARKILSSKKTGASVEKAVRYVLTHPQAARIGYKNTIGLMTPSLPYFHDASYQTLILAALTGNVRSIIMPDSAFNPENILATVEKEKPAFMANVPTGWKKIVSCENFDQYDVGSLMAAATGAGACSADLKRKIFEKFPGILLLDMFGQTEMTPITSFRIDTGPETVKERSVGKSILEVRIVDENDNDVPRGEVGEIMYKSGWIMKGYYKDEQQTSATMKDGWFKGGDLGYIDEEGEVRIVDRKKECINSGGEKIFPLEVEEVLHNHPHVQDVCVIGVPDEEWGHTVRAVVQPATGITPDPEEIISFCRGKLAGFKIPKSVVFVEELPLSPVGKVLRSKIREFYGQPEQA